MKAPVAILGFVLACVAALSGCGDDDGGGGTPRPTSKELTSFSFLVKNNPGLVADATATIVGETVSVMVPFDTDVTALIATYTATGVSVQVNGVAQLSNATKNDFTNPVTYHITAGDGSTKDYKVAVEVAKSSAKELTAFAFRKASNPALDADITATINGTAIAATVPFGTDVTQLVATFTTSGSAVTVGSTAQVSGTTPNNFTAPVTYKVAAADGSTKDYAVTITVAKNTAKAITAFAFLSANNAGLATDITATINGTAIAATVPYATDVTKLVATFASTGAAVTVADVAQISGTTANDFTNAVAYKVTAADGSSQSYTATITVAKNPAKELTAFAFLSAKNPGLPGDVTATINGTAIAATVPFATDVTKLVATFTTTGASVKVGTATQDTGITANDFTAPVDYVVTAADGTTKTYTVTVAIAKNPAKDLTAFAFLSINNPGLPADVVATINGTAIAATVPFATDVSALVATFATTGDKVAVGTAPQVSGMTANNFAAPVDYLVTAADGTTKAYTVTVTIAKNPAKELTAFAFLSVNNSGLPADVTATINGTAIAATVPFGTDVTALVATFATTGASVKVGATAQTSGVTANNFTAPVAYEVTAADGTTKTYQVAVTIALNPAKDLTAFSFRSANNADLPADVIATINGTDVAATVPFGTDVTALVATFATTGASVKVGATAQTSGLTANDFTAPVAYEVTAADGTTKTYQVAVTIAPSSSKDLTAFAFLSANNAGLNADVIATITGTSVAATVPFGTDITALVATFATTGATVKVGTTTQASGMTPNNFTAPVAYLVTAIDGTSQTYTVAVTIAPSPAKDLTAFAFLSANNAGLPADIVATIVGTNVTATVPFGTDVTALIATFATTGAHVEVGANVQVSGITANNFTAPVAYDVIAADGSAQTYTVTVAIDDGSAKALTAFAFLKASNPALPADAIATIDEATKTISVMLPFSTELETLVATFATTGNTVKVGTTAQVSGTTPNNFNDPVTYTVAALNGSTANYTVQVDLSPAPKISAFAFLSANNPSLPGDSTTTFGQSGDITVHVSAAADLTQLVASFETIVPATVTVNGATQTSGATANDFTAPVAYHVVGEDGGFLDYTVIVKADLPSAKDLTSFSFTGAKNPTMFLFEMKGTITGTNVVVEVPFGINPGALIATFTTNGTKVTVNGTTQVSGTTPNSFLAPVTYVVTAGDNSTKAYTVTLVPLVTSFAFTGSNGNELTFNADTNNPVLASLPVMARSPGGGATNAAGAFGGNGWNTAAINTAHYFTFTVTAGAGRTLNLTRLQFRDQRSGTGPTSFAVRSSLDGFAADLKTGTTHDSFGNNETTLSGFVGQAQVEFRIYAWGASVPGGTFRIDDVQLSGAVPQTVQ